MDWELVHTQITCTSLQTGNHTNASSVNFFYMPDALPDAQPTVSRLVGWLGLYGALNTN